MGISRAHTQTLPSMVCGNGKYWITLKKKNEFSIPQKLVGYETP